MPYQYEVEIPQENMEEQWKEDRESVYSTFVQPDSSECKFQQ